MVSDTIDRLILSLPTNSPAYRAVVPRFMRLRAIAHDAKPLIEAMESGDPERIAGAKEPYEALAREHLSTITALRSGFEEAMVVVGVSEEERREIREWLAAMLVDCERVLARVNIPAELFGATGKPIGDA
ncbi:hypothetical protein [Polyangium sp. 15x6]|uniref:hypothetical protein n=1 Tax=Polyangium sp. 15x6 TaxID=3042687 RepID=UPI00249AAA33|nr:hypothetical protein [Polyangium sp. 15x6]MDI3284946.1 hypothetical protein [Polyangium sp. 15x6]